MKNVQSSVLKFQAILSTFSFSFFKLEINGWNPYILVRIPCKMLEPYDNDWDFSYGVRERKYQFLFTHTRPATLPPSSLALFSNKKQKIAQGGAVQMHLARNKMDTNSEPKVLNLKDKKI
jgi:hypothetical protein